MAINVTNQGKFLPHAQGSGLVVFAVTFTSGTNYATGGVTVDLSPLKLPVVFADVLQITCDSNGGHSGWYIFGTNLTNGKFQLFNGTTEIGNGTGLAGTVLICSMTIGHGIL